MAQELPAGSTRVFLTNIRSPTELTLRCVSSNGGSNHHVSMATRDVVQSADAYSVDANVCRNNVLPVYTSFRALLEAGCAYKSTHIYLCGQRLHCKGSECLLALMDDTASYGGCISKSESELGGKVRYLWYLFMYVCMYACMHGCMCVNTHTHTHTNDG
jgi:hypothetical protein